MKILDIVTEDLVGAFFRGLEKGSGKVATPADRAIAGTERGAERAAADAPAAAEKSVAKQGTWEKWEKWVDDELKAQGDKAVNDAIKTKVLTHFNSKLEGFADWLGWANIAGWVAWYWGVAKPRLDKEYKATGMDEGTYQQKLTELRGKVITQIIMPRVALKLGQKVGVNWVVSRVPWLLNAVGAKNTALAVKGLGTAAGSTAAYAYFSSPAGQQFIADWLGPVSLGLGVAANLGEKLVGALTSSSSTSTVQPTNLQWTGQPASGAKQDIDATSNEPIFGKPAQGTKWADTSKSFF